MERAVEFLFNSCVLDSVLQKERTNEICQREQKKSVICYSLDAESGDSFSRHVGAPLSSSCKTRLNGNGHVKRGV